MFVIWKKNNDRFYVGDIEVRVRFAGQDAILSFPDSSAVGYIVGRSDCFYDDVYSLKPDDSMEFDNVEILVQAMDEELHLKLRTTMDGASIAHISVDDFAHEKNRSFR